MDKGRWLYNTKLYVICTLIAVFSQIVQASEQASNKLELSALANLAKAELKNDDWHTILPLIGNEDEYYLATATGKIYQLNHNEVAQKPFFNLKSALNNPDILALTAITLDPSFNYRDRDGYHTFYTAHTEPSRAIKPKLTPNNTEVSVPYDTVLIRWQITFIPNQAPSVSKKAEVMRIAIPQAQESIYQLSFNPYVESWHEGYGLLFIALAQSERLTDQALYSGTILRIKPKRYGFLSYTIPASNPFTKVANIANEIVFIAGQKTSHFDWIKKNKNVLLIQLNQQDKNIPVQAKLGDDWRESPPQAQIDKQLPSNATQQKTLLYHGRELKNLWGKYLYLQEVDNNWQLQASALFSPVISQEKMTSTRHQLVNYNANQPAKFSLHQRHNGELLLLEHNQQHLYTIKAPETVIATTDINNPPITTSSNNSAFVLIFFMMVMLTSYVWYLKKNANNKAHFLYEQWSNFDINPATKSLSLYKRHNDKVEQIIKISTLVSSELLLNDEIISTVSADSAQAFSNVLENDVLTLFSKEHRLKMLNNKQRKIQLCLTDNQNTRYLFCFYYRVGNIRHTKLKYNNVINKVIDWHWLFAQFINPDATAKRKIKVKLKPKQLTTQTVAPITARQNSTCSTREDDSPFYDDGANANKLAKADEDVADLDTKLVSALDKLVMMKKQGYLSESEFNSAKAKILKDLASE